MTDLEAITKLVDAISLIEKLKAENKLLREMNDKLMSQALRQPLVMVRSEQLPCPNCGQLEPCAGNSPETCYHPKVC